MKNIEPGPLERLVDEEHITIMKNGQKVMEFPKADDGSLIVALVTLDALVDAQLDPHEVEHFRSILVATLDWPF